MRKKALIAFCAVFFLTTAVFVLALPLHFAEAPASAFLQGALGAPVSIERIDYRLFNRVTFTNLTIGTAIHCRKATVSFNPWKLIFYRDKLTAIISIKLNMLVAGRSVDVLLHPDLSNVIKVAAEVSSPESHAKLLVSVQANNGIISGAYVLSEFAWQGYRIENASGTFLSSPSNLSATLFHPSITAKFNGISFSTFTVSAHANLSGFMPAIAGTADILFDKNGKKIDGQATCADARWNNHLLASFATVRFNNNPQSGSWYAEAAIGPAQYIAKCYLNSDGALRAALKGPNGSICNISGIVSSHEANILAKGLQYLSSPSCEMKLHASIDESAINLKEFAFSCNDGTLTAYGLIGRLTNSPQSNVSITAHNFPVPSGAKISGSFKLNASFRKNNGIYSGQLSGANFSINKIYPLSLASHFSCSSKELIIDTLDIYPYLKSTCVVNFHKAGKITGEMSIIKFPVQHIISGLKGLVSADAAISGSLTNPTISFHAFSPSLTCKTVVFSANCRAQLKEKRVFVDTVDLKSANGAAHFSGLVTPELKLNGNIENMDMRILSHLINGFPISAGGLLSATANAKGSIDKPAIGLYIKGRNISLGKLSGAYIEGRVNYTPSLIIISTTTVHIADSEFVVTNSTIDFVRSFFDVTTVSKNIHAGPFDLFGVARLIGGWKSAKGGKPALSASLQVKDLWINQCSVPAARVNLRYDSGLLNFAPARGQALRISGSIGLKSLPQLTFKKFTISRQLGERTFVVAGETGPGKWDFTINARKIPANILGELLNYNDLLEGDIDAKVSATGSMGAPQIDSNINLVNGAIAGIPCDVFALQVSVLHDVATITHARWVKEGMYTVVANGYIPFALTSAAYKRVLRNAMDVTISVEEGSLGFLTSVSDNIKSARGALHSQLRLAGTLQRPVANGYINIVNGEIESKKYIKKITALNANCIWRNNLLTLSNCRGLVGNGAVSLSGSVKFNGIEPALYDLTLKTGEGHGIPLSIPDLPIPSPLIKTGITSSLSRGEPQFSLKLSGNAAAPVLSGYGQLDNTNFTFPSLTPKSDNESIIYPLFTRLRWDLELRSGKNTWYENELVHANIQGAIHLGGIGAHPDVDGKIEAIRGNITYLGTEFTIKHATFEITKNNAVLDGQAEAELTNTQTNVPDIIDVDVSRAPIEKIIPRFSSPNNPGITQDKALALVAGADPERMSNTDQQYYVRQQFIRLFDSTLATPIAKNILRRSGLADTFHVSYQPKANLVSATPGTPSLSELMVGTKYSMEKYLTDRMLVGYSVAFDQAQNRLDLRHELELSYRWAPNLYLKGIYDLNSDDTSQADRRVTVERQWRFGFGSGSKNKSNNKSKKDRNDKEK